MRKRETTVSKDAAFLQHVGRLLRNHWILITVITSVAIIGLLLVSVYQYQINPDGISYITIAEKYARGDFSNALNGYWGPLLSLLITPAIWLNIEPIIAIKILQVVLVVGLMVIAYAFIRLFTGRTFAILGMGVLGIFGLDWGLRGPLTPDLLMCLLSLTLVYCLAILGKRAGGYTIAISTGIIGALLYFAKASGLVLFLIFWVGWLTITLVRARTQRLPITSNVLRPLLVSLVVFLLIILPWVIAISAKYGYLTIGTSAGYNLALVGPTTEGQPLFSRGLLPPPNDSAVSVWEDISTVPIHTWNPLGSLEDIKYALVIIKNNFLNLHTIMPLILIVLAALALLYILWAAKKQDSPKLWLLAILGFGTTALYLPVFVEDRYIWATFAAILIVYIIFLAHLSQTKRYAALVFGSVLLLWALSVPIQSLAHHRLLNKNVYDESQALHSVMGPGNRVASDEFGAIYACYYTKAHCYGELKPDSPQAKEQLHHYAIDRLLLTPESAAQLQAVSGITLHSLSDVRYNGRLVYVIDW